jgi:hypothetical protein
MDVCRVLCVVRQRSLRRADHSSRGLIPTVASRVWSRNLVDEEAIARAGLHARENNNNKCLKTPTWRQLISELGIT